MDVQNMLELEGLTSFEQLRNPIVDATTLMARHPIVSYRDIIALKEALELLRTDSFLGLAQIWEGGKMLIDFDVY